MLWDAGGFIRNAVDRLAGDMEATKAQLEAAKLNVPITDATARSRLASEKAAIIEAEAELSGACAGEKSAGTWRFAIDIAAPRLRDRKQLPRTFRKRAGLAEKGQVILGKHRVRVVLFELVAIDCNASQEIIPGEALFKSSGGNNWSCG
jgi:hypothetical protein